MLQPNEIGRNERGAEVCRRIRKVAVQKVPGNDAKGFKQIDAYCGQPVVLSISEGGKTCSVCEKAPPIGNVHPRVTNSAGVSLTPAELKECGVEDGEDPSLKPAPAKIEKKPKEAKPAVEAKVKNEAKKDEVVLSIPLKDLEGDTDVAAFLIKKVIEGFGTLPVTNFAESKRLIRLEEKLQSMLGA